MNPKLVTTFEEIQNIPNAPFLTLQVQKYIETKLKLVNRNYINNNYSIICNYPSNPSKPKLVIMGHTDHPGVVMKNGNEGLLFGTPGIKRLREKIEKEGGVFYKVFSPEGKLLGKTKLVNIKKDNRTGVFNSEVNIPTNSFAQYDELDYYKETKETFEAYNADDGISFATMLTFIGEKLESNYDVYWVFSLYEEVHQVTAWHLAKNNTLNIKKEDIFLNLECQKVEDIIPEKYGNTTYHDGVIIQLSNTGCLFGYKSKEKNLTETLLRESAKKIGTKPQIGLIKDSCDSRPFSYFDLSPNIATLNVPNRYKHNENEYGKLVPEEIYKKDVNDFYNIIKTALTIEKEQLENSKEENVSYKIRQNDDITNHKLMEDKAKLNNRVAHSYKAIVKRGYFYPKNTIDQINDITGGIIFYFIFLLQKIYLR